MKYFENKAQGLEKLLQVIAAETQELERAGRDVYDLYEYWAEADEDDAEAAHDFIDAAYAYIRKLENLARLQAMAIDNLKTKTTKGN